MVELLLAVDISGWWHEIVYTWETFDLAKQLRVVGALITISIAILSAVIKLKNLFKRRIARRIVDPQKMWEKKIGRISSSRYTRELSNSIPIISIANFKGGSGKTTVSANLAAYYDSIGARVLLIDFDYHASLSSLIPLTYSKAKNKEIVVESKASFLLERQRPLPKGKSATDSFQPLKIGGGFERSFIYTANKNLNHSENSLLMKFVANQEIKEGEFLEKRGVLNRIKRIPMNIKNSWWRWWHRGYIDIRFNTFHYLMEDEIQHNFEVVIIDTPGHVTPSLINALCTSTHLLIPTQLDSLSANVTANSLEVFRSLKRKLSLNIEILGIVPSMAKKYNNVLVRREVDVARDLLNKTRMLVWEEESIWQEPSIIDSNTGDLGFFNNKGVYDSFKRLGDQVISELSDEQKNKMLRRSEELEVISSSDDVLLKKVTAPDNYDFGKKIEQNPLSELKAG